MKLTKLVAFLLSILLSVPGYAECVLSTDIKKVEGAGYLYTDECHRYVGKKFMENKDLHTQVNLYKDLVKLQEDQIKLQSDRADLWRNTSLDLENRVSNIEWSSEKSKLFYFGAGVLLTLGAAWAAGQASK